MNNHELKDKLEEIYAELTLFQQLSKDRIEFMTKKFIKIQSLLHKIITELAKQK